MKKSLLTAVLMVFFTGAFAQPGVLDQTFGVGGKTKVLKGTRVSAMVQQNNGKTIVASLWDENPFYVYGTNVKRVNVDGSIDTSFHFDTSKSLISFIRTFEQTSSGANDGFLIYQMAVQSDQKIWAIVHSYKRSNVSGQRMLKNAYLCRFSDNGMLETITHLPINNIFYDENIYGLTNIVVRPNGNILFGIGGIPPGTLPGSNNLSKLWLYQFKSNGTFDSTFGNNGKVSVKIFGDIINHRISEIFTVYPLIYGIALSSDNRIFVGSAKYDTITSQETVTFMRFSPNGVFDTTYGIHGFAEANFGATNFYFDAMALTPENNGLIVGHFKENNNGHRTIVGLVCFDSTGSLNSNFGVGGKVYATFDSIDNRVNAMQLQKDGKIVLTGYVTGRILNNPLVNKILKARFNGDGTADSLFGKNGVLRVSFTPDDYSFTSLIQPDGKIVLAGVGFFKDSGNSNNFYSTIVRFDSTEMVNYNTLIVSTFLDKNSNGIKDANETFFPNGKLVTTKSGIETIVSYSIGDRSLIYLDSGIYTTTYIPTLPYHNSFPANHVISHTTYFHTDSVAFALQPIPGKRDLSVQLIPLSTAMAGFPNNYQIAYENRGTDTIANGIIQLLKSKKLNFINATPTPTSVSGDTLRWNISSLKPLESGNILANFTVKTPPSVNIGDTIQSTVKFTSNKPDLTPEDNTSIVKQIVRGSYDPNDKTENHGGKITTVQVANGDYLQYTIRFQNTGNDTAFNVYIRDTLDNKLDWNTMQILTASHSYQITMNDGNKCLFTFRNINLVDSITNEAGSHGYIVYKVKPKPTVALGDIIKNTAAIYFDYNLPIITNTETTTIVSEVLPLRLLSFSAKRDNKTNLLNWTTTNEINVDHFEIERSSNPNSSVGTGGREFSKIGIVKAGNTNYTFVDNNPLKTVNYYRLKMMDKDGKFEYSPIRMINNNTNGQISIYPNPARDKVTVTHPSNIGIAQLQLTDMTGRIIRRATVATSSVQTNMNIKGLPAGKYNITWSNGLISHTQALVIE